MTSYLYSLFFELRDKSNAFLLYTNKNNVFLGICSNFNLFP